jgi:hypothetical protein
MLLVWCPEVKAQLSHFQLGAGRIVGQNPDAKGFRFLLLSVSYGKNAAWAGEKELALQQLETGLRAPNASLMLSYGALKLLPFWDPLRGDPRFEQIVQSLAPKDKQ